LNVVVSCQVDQHLLAKNFTTIINALKELQQAQLRNESQIKDLSSLKDKFDSLSEKVEKIEKAQALTSKESQAKQSKSAAN
jgi:predicted  nucleic acid-binding Zn-ribbon protein